MNDAPVDVLVVGGGPGGSATAALLARQGYRVRLVDRAAFPRDKACSEYMSPETVRLLDHLGVVGALEAAGAMPLDGTTVIAPRGGRLLGRFTGAEAPSRATGLAVSRRTLDHALLEAARAAGAEVSERTVVEELLYDGGAVAGVVARDGAGRRHAVRARLTVGADGLRSVVARRIGRRRHGRLRRLAFVAHVEGVREMERMAELHVGPRGYVGLNRIGGGRTNVAVVVPAERGAGAKGRAEAFFLEAIEAFPGVARRVSGGALARKVLATGPFDAWSGRIVTDGAALVGDAADFFDPFTGEGIYSALRGAELLAESAGAALADGEPATAARLAGYRRTRRRAFAGKWAIERIIGYAMLCPPLFDRAVARIGRRPGMADTLIGVTGDLLPARRVLNPLYFARMLL
ncbi:MAG: NAD(P)/FAD-dependent oxidoreductase [Gemmatimonadales bacterium]